MIKVLIAGQTPPPHHGLSVMAEKMLEGRYAGVELCHVRMAFSEEIDDVGKPGLRKVAELARVIGAIVKARFVEGADVLWFPPAGPNYVPMIRDIAVLLSTRWLFRKTILHFHSGGVSELYERLPRLLRPLFRAAYFYPDAAVRISELAPEDGKRLRARQEFIVPNGIEDEYNGAERETRGEGRPTRILFVGTVRRSKGVMTLLRACRALAEQDVAFRADLMGQFISPAFEREARRFVREHQLGEHVTFLGVRTGQDKLRAFAAADLFCFPSYYPSETFGLVLVEAMSFELPIVATQWRGIPSVVGEDEACAFLVPTQDPAAVADRLKRLIDDPALRQRMGRRGRARFREHFTVERYQERMGEVFRRVGGSPS